MVNLPRLGVVDRPPDDPGDKVSVLAQQIASAPDFRPDLARALAIAHAVSAGVEILRRGLPEEVAEDVVASIGRGPRGVERYRSVIRETISELFSGRAGVFPQPLQAPSASDGPVLGHDGSFVHEAEDLHLDGAGIDLIFRRTYASGVIFDGLLGVNWDFELGPRLKATDAEVRLSSGDLREVVFRRHPQWGDPGFDYFIPPDGAHAVLLARGSSFVRRHPDGRVDIFQPDPDWSGGHRLTRIEDRFGNYLQLEYSSPQLRRILVNHPERWVELRRDDSGRLAAVLDFSGRKWGYSYDAQGDLIAVWAPGAKSPTIYEYENHYLMRWIDPDGRLRIENEYGLSGLDRRRVIRQRHGAGEVFYSYENLGLLDSFSGPEEDRPAHQTNFVARDGHPIHLIYNARGNLLLREELIGSRFRPRALVWRHRYNADGEMTASISPEGRVTQTLWGRQDFERTYPDPADRDAHLTANTRASFGRVLALVRRERRSDWLSRAAGSALASWSPILPSVFVRESPGDVITKLSYEPEYGQKISESDPRATNTPDPNGAEPADYFAYLTRYFFDGTPARYLRRLEYPAPTWPDGSRPGPVIWEITAHDAQGRVERIVDPSRVVQRIEYYASGPRSGQVERVIVDPDGLAIATRFERDVLGRIIALHSPRGHATRFGYDPEDHLLWTRSPLLTETRFFYDGAGSVVRSESELRDDTGAPIEGGLEIDEWTYNGDLQLARHVVRDATGSRRRATAYLYDAAGRKSQIILPRGNRVRFAHDERGLEIRRTLAAGSEVEGTQSFDYDDDGMLVASRDARGFTSVIDRDGRGMPTEVRDPQGNARRCKFDPQGRLLVDCVFSRAADGALALLSRNEYRYDELGRQIVIAKNRFDRPAHALSTIDYLDSGPGLLIEEKLFYDAAGKLLRHDDPVGRSTRYEYDSAGRLERSIDPAGIRLELRRDGGGNLVRQDRHEPLPGALGGEVFTEIFAYDELDRQIEHIDAFANRSIERYDSRDLPILSIDPLGGTIRTRHDVFGDLVESTSSGPDGRPPRTKKYEYDDNGNLVALIDPLGRREIRSYDARDYLRAIHDNAGTIRAFDYDADGHLYLTRETNGAVLTETIDELGRSIRTEVDLSAVEPGLIVEGARFSARIYDALGNIVSEENDYSRIEREIDSLGNVTLERTIIGARSLILRRRFTDSGALERLEYPSGASVIFGRDSLDRPTLVDSSRAGAVAAFSYVGLQRSGVQLGNGVRSTFGVDGIGRPNDLQHHTAAGTFFHMQRLFDGAGRVRADVEAPRGFFYSRDASLRLRSEREVSASILDLSGLAPAATAPPEPLPARQTIADGLAASLVPPGAALETWQLDDASNRLRERPPSGAEIVYEPDDRDRYLRVGGVSRQYDRNGNLLRDGRHEYRYDAWNRLVRILPDDAQFILAPDGLRLIERRPGEERVLIRDGAEVIGEYSTGDEREHIYADGDAGPLCTLTGAGNFWLHEDLSGSLRRVTDSVGRLIAEYDLSPFGAERRSVEGLFQPANRFEGKRIDRETGNYDFGARYYEPEAGRFLQRDPIISDEAVNAYEYALSDPLAFFDPNGESPVEKLQYVRRPYDPTAWKRADQLWRKGNREGVSYDYERPSGPDPQQPALRFSNGYDDFGNPRLTMDQINAHREWMMARLNNIRSGGVMAPVAGVVTVLTGDVEKGERGFAFSGLVPDLTGAGLRKSASPRRPTKPASKPARAAARVRRVGSTGGNTTAEGVPLNWGVSLVRVKAKQGEAHVPQWKKMRQTLAKLWKRAQERGDAPPGPFQIVHPGSGYMMTPNGVVLDFGAGPASENMSQGARVEKPCCAARRRYNEAHGLDPTDPNAFFVRPKKPRKRR